MIISQLLNIPLFRFLPQSSRSKQVDGCNRNNKGRKKGKVFLVGSGPGDAELLTLKAHRLLQQTDVVLYDSLVNPEIIEMLPKQTLAIYVGKRCGQHSMSQLSICQLMSEYALKGKDVVRLKGGDPAIFGRTAEELNHLQKHDIEFAIVPGVTAASGCSAWSGIPLTHREHAHSVRYITAHFNNDKIQADWKNYAESNDTLVFYMGLSKIKDIAANLIRYGKPKSTPIAIVDQGTTKQHSTHISSLENIGQVIESVELKGPALVMVGLAITDQASVKPELLNFANSYE